MVQLSEKKYIIKHLSVGSKRKRFKYSNLAATARICGEGTQRNETATWPLLPQKTAKNNRRRWFVAIDSSTS